MGPSTIRGTTTSAALTALMLGASLVACGGATYLGEGRDTAYGQAVEAVLDKQWETGIKASWSYLATASPDDERFDRAQMLFAQSAEGMKLRFAASLFYLDVAQSRRLPDLADEAVSGIERIIDAGSYDEATIVRGFLGTDEITALPVAQTNFVAYVQGLESVRQGLDEWADDRFDEIDEESPYFHKARYVKAVRHLTNRRWDEGRAALEAMLEEPRELPKDIRVEARLALARLAMEQRRFREAVELYEKVEDVATERPELLLEMAWAYYYLGDSRQALGRLIALDAPAYQALIAPERFLLEAFCLRRLCQFEPARIAAVRLRDAYGEALDDLHRGILPLTSEPLRNAAKQRGEARALAEFVARLERELAIVEDRKGSFGESLTQRLRAIYEDGLFEAERRLEQVLRDEVRDLSDELVAAEDGVRLVLHELSVGLLRGRRRPPGPPEAPAPRIRAAGGRVFYRFRNEFWTDEVDDLLVLIKDRCLQ